MICRLCLKESECCLEIFDMNGEQLGIADILKRHFWFQPLPTDAISTVICRICWFKVSDFHQFYLTVEQAHLLLNNMEVKHETINIVVDKNYADLTEEIKVEISECQGPDEVAETTINPLHELEFDNAGRDGSEDDNDVQPEDVREQILTPVVKYDNDDDADKTIESKKVTRPKRKYIKRPPAPARKKPKQRQKSDAEDDNSSGDGDDDEGDGAEKPKRVKAINSTLEDDAMVKKHIAMGCDLCTFVAEDFVGMSKHFRLQHAPIKPYVRCCEKKLNKRSKVVQHAYRHEDPEFFKCKECLKVFSDRYTLNTHMASTHAPEELLQFACDQCPKKFARKHLLDLHRPSHIPMDERAFVCDQCPNSRFASSHLLNIHTSMRHRRATNVCHVCAKEIRDKASFEKHVRLHFEDSGPRVKCPRPNCDRWLKDEENLRQHLRRHNDEGLEFKCNECGRNCKNRRALHSHIMYVHSNEVFTCEECNKTFKKAITLREHMAQHTGESLYKCPFCTRTFNSNANMHSHKKKMHPVEWDIWRKTKKGSSQQLISKQQSSF